MIVWGDLKAKNQKKLSLPSLWLILFIWTTAVDASIAEQDSIATVQVIDSDDAPQAALSFTTQLSLVNLDFALNSLKSHLVQDLAMKPKILSCPLSPSILLLSLLSCFYHTFLALLILVSKFTQDWCSPNKAWAKVLGLQYYHLTRLAAVSAP